MSTYLSILSSESIEKKDLFKLLEKFVKRNKIQIIDNQYIHDDGTAEITIFRNDNRFRITLDSDELYDSINEDYKDSDFYKNLGAKYGSIITIIVGQIESSILLNDFLKSIFEDHPEFLLLNDEVDDGPYVFSASQVIIAVGNASNIPFNANDWIWETPIEEDIV